jgi:hypothetical protein
LWPKVRWPRRVAHLPTVSPFFQATTKGCPILRAVSSREGWESTNLSPSGAGSPANFYPAPFFWRGPAEGSWPHRRWLQIISFIQRTMEMGEEMARALKPRKNVVYPTPLSIIIAFSAIKTS